VAENIRTAKRYACALEIEWSVNDVRQKSVTKNVSLGGVFIESATKMAFGVRVQLRFKVPNQREPIEVTGVVRWDEPGGFGVQFDGLRARDVWALGKFFEQQSPLR
jgi:hypothetical protein